MEGKFGFTTVFSIIEFPPASKYCDILKPNNNDYKKSLDIAWRLRKIGKPIGAIDMIIASMCINRNLQLLTKDRDFEVIKQLEPKFKLKVK